MLDTQILNCWVNTFGLRTQNTCPELLWVEPGCTGDSRGPTSSESHAQEDILEWMALDSLYWINAKSQCPRAWTKFHSLDIWFYTDILGNHTISFRSFLCFFSICITSGTNNYFQFTVGCCLRPSNDNTTQGNVSRSISALQLKVNLVLTECWDEADNAAAALSMWFKAVSQLCTWAAQCFGMG